jgi:5,10-methylenetetrahydromethanopterin reductase
LEEVTVTTGKLLAGEEVTFSGQYLQLDRTKLVHSPTNIPPISLGVIGPHSLRLSGRVAGGTILSEYSNPAYVAWAKEQIEQGRQAGSQNRGHRLTVFAFACAASTTASARLKLRPMIAAAIASGGLDPKLNPMGIMPEVRKYRENGGQKALEANMPDEWIDQLSIAGTPDDWKLAIGRLVKLGVHAVVLVPLPEAGLDELGVFARHLAL